MTRTYTDEDIARDWPDAWARANDTTRPGASKRRNRVRAEYRKAKEFDAWRAEHPDAACSNCRHCDPCLHEPGRICCGLESTGGTYTLTTPDNVCIRWRPQ